MTRPLTRRGFLAGLVAAPVAVPAVAARLLQKSSASGGFIAGGKYVVGERGADLIARDWTPVRFDMRRVIHVWSIDHDGAPAAPAAGGEQPNAGQGGGVPSIPSGAPS